MLMDEPNGIGRAVDIASYQRPPDSAKPKARAACFDGEIVDDTPNARKIARGANLVPQLPFVDHTGAG